MLLAEQHMKLLVTRIAQRHAVIDIESLVLMLREVVDVVGFKSPAPFAAYLASEIVTLIDRAPPMGIFMTVMKHHILGSNATLPGWA